MLIWMVIVVATAVVVVGRDNDLDDRTRRRNYWG